MKKIFFLLGIYCLISTFSFAQKGFNYQGVVRDGAGVIIGNQNVVAQFSILDSIGGNVLYTETQNLIINGFGLINHVIGTGMTIDTFENINWFDGARFLNVKLTLNGGSEKDLGTSQIVSVPMALMAEHSMDWPRNGDDIIYQPGKSVGIGTNDPGSKLHIKVADQAKQIRIERTGSSPGYSDIGGRDGDLYFWPGGYSSGGTNQGNGNVIFKTTGGIGIGTATPATPLHIHTQNKNEGLKISTQGFSESIHLHLAKTGSIEYGFLKLGGGTILRGNGHKSFFDGEVEVKCLQITGGCDLAEYKQNHDSRSLEPGDVVLIDPTDPKGVLLSDQPYNKTAIGIYSGANGVKPGMILSQEGVLDGDIPVAIAGQVYVKVTGKVKPGDLLTSSKIPGHAMVVKNYKKAMGAIIGKAISTKDENGFALVLIGRQ
ncbi:MAG: hypothetical protein KDE26_03420 [Bacteroidetes bacterium]|nr:hypothetical protein [Bacteroidota bacterium]MCB0842299.1 hypothetical protein [Bacteroidota bacterium]